jgi:splicing factor 3B subunit 3
MHLYNVTLQEPTVITKAIVGNFTGAKGQEVLVVKGSCLLQVCRVDSNTGKLVSVSAAQNVFSSIRSILPVRMTGATTDYVAMTTDSGNMSILKYEGKAFESVYQEPYGKSGMRRVVAGEYLACDPRGRALMVGAVERQKFVYLLNRDSENKLTISSPLEAHRNHYLLYSVVGVDVGYDNPMFACLELDMGDLSSDETTLESRKKVVSFYEVDLGLNHVVRKYTETVSRDSHMLVALPGGHDGPSGVLVCAGDVIIWRNPGHASITLQLPRRDDCSGKSLFFVSSTVHRMKNMFFVLLQTELGDLFKVSFDYDNSSNSVQEIKLSYFDSVPVSNSLCVLKSGFLVCAAELGNNYVFQIESLGDNEQSAEFTSNDMRDDEEPAAVYKARELKNLAVVDEIQSAPFIETKVMNLTQDDSPQFYSISGRGPNSTFKITKPGVQINQLIEYPLQGTPTAVWSVKKRRDDQYQSYIIISFINATMILGIGDTVDEVTDSEFIPNVSSLLVQQIGADGLIQIHSSGYKYFRQVTPNGETIVKEWKPKYGSKVTHAAANNRQVLLVLNTNELVYFELKEQDGSLKEHSTTKKVPFAVSCVALGPVPEGRIRSKFLAIGTGDQTVRMLSLDPNSTFEPLAMQATNASPKSLHLSFHGDSTDENVASKQLILNVGMENGVYMRTLVDQVTGSLSDTRNRYLGNKPVKVFPIELEGNDVVFCLSSRSWFSYCSNQTGARIKLVPSNYSYNLEYASSFISEQCPEGIICISGNSLHILTVEQLSNEFNTQNVPLERTPRRFVYVPTSSSFVIVEYDHNPEILSKEQIEKKNQFKFEEDKEEEEEDEEQNNRKNMISAPRKGKGNYDCLLRVLNPLTGQTTQRIALADNEIALSITALAFFSHPNFTYVIAGVVKDYDLKTRSYQSANLDTYFVDHEGKLIFVHRTPLDGLPQALCPFQGRILVGLGKALRIYDLGKTKLLRKTETKGFPATITKIETQGERIYVSDIQESITMAQYNFQENKIVIFADDSVPRWTSDFVVLDYNTVAGADKFGTFFVLRLPKDAIEEFDDEQAVVGGMFDRAWLNGASRKVNHLIIPYTNI